MVLLAEISRTHELTVAQLYVGGSLDKRMVTLEQTLSMENLHLLPTTKREHSLWLRSSKRTRQV